MNVGQVLRGACTLPTPEGAWTQEEIARQSDGSQVPHNSKKAVCFCIEGAFKRVAMAPGVLRAEQEDLVSSAMDFFLQKAGCWPHEWNDAPGRTQAEVVAMLDRLATEHGA